MKLQKLFFAAVIILSANAAFAQPGPVSTTHNININIPDVAVIGLVASESTDIILEGEPSSVAGLPIDFSTATDATIWMNYSSITKGNSTRNITAIISSGDDVPAGLKLTVTAGADADGGKGKMGTTGGPLTLNKSDFRGVVTGIGSAYTGTGVGAGHNLTYKLELLDDTKENYGLLEANETTALVVTYTLTDILE